MVGADESSELMWVPVNVNSFLIYVHLFVHSVYFIHIIIVKTVLAIQTCIFN